MREELCGLGDYRREHPAALHGGQVRTGDALVTQRSGEDTGCRDSVLNGKIDPDTTEARHRVGRIADAQQPVGVPAGQPVYPHIQQLYLIHRSDLVGHIRQFRHHVDEIATECLHSPCP
ncbi:Uncharacterised protein [Mycobacteroides abscessus subsp. massiliense]|nr:Uncharacterised protein [Mycobacteroides abscessus subsp. massiliense]